MAKFKNLKLKPRRELKVSLGEDIDDMPTVFEMDDHFKEKLKTISIEENSETIPEQTRNNSETKAKQFRNNKKESGTSNTKPSISETIPKPKRNNSETTSSDIQVTIAAKSVDIRNNSETISEQEAKQFRNNSETKKVSDSDSKSTSETIPEQNRNTIQNNSETDAKQFRNNIRNNSETEILHLLHGNEASICRYLFKHCQSIGERITPRLSLSIIRMDLAIKSVDITRVSTNRLIQKGILLKHSSKTGKGGWVRYEFPENIYKDMSYVLRNNSETDAKQFRSDTRNNSETESETTVPSSSSSLNINNHDNTNTRELDEWDSINIEPLEGIGFTRGYLKQFKQKTELTPLEVEDSIRDYAHDLEHNKAEMRKQLKSDLASRKLDFFVRCIIGSKAPYVSPKAQTDAIDPVEAHLADIARRKAEREEKEGRVLLETFEDWYELKPYEEKCQMCDLDSSQRHLPQMLKSGCLEYFKLHEWPRYKQELFD
jgi:hypothetical protein